jgi:hypothetical protein
MGGAPMSRPCVRNNMHLHVLYAYNDLFANKCYVILVSKKKEWKLSDTSP